MQRLLQHAAGSKHSEMCEEANNPHETKVPDHVSMSVQAYSKHKQKFAIILIGYSTLSTLTYSKLSFATNKTLQYQRSPTGWISLSGSTVATAVLTNITFLVLKHYFFITSLNRNS